MPDSNYREHLFTMRTKIKRRRLEPDAGAWTFQQEETRVSANAIKLGFLGVNVERFDLMTAHYGKVLGLPALDDARAEAYFSCGNDAYAVSLHRGGPRGYRHLGFQIDGEGPLTD